MTTHLKGAQALVELLTEAPAWLPPVVGWEIGAATEADPRHVMGQLDDEAVGKRTLLRKLAEETGGEFQEGEPVGERDGSHFRNLGAEFWFAGARFTVWVLVIEYVAVPS
ncbi:hypothetical protein [Embleya sp. NPDC005971]|uniref:hypothetical protein n=1 Tax=Embleya sp. NPDC005971 TaxID=3156724 RepID=UPI0033EF9455